MNQYPANINAISCKSCNANLELLGNTFRSKILCCAYCGTVMDSQKDFKALYTFTHIQQPSTPLAIGMSGNIQNVNFTIAGYIAYKSRDEKWMHFQLYSPTHGYALLIYKNNQYLFLRKTYQLPDKNLWTLKEGDSFNVEQQYFQIKDFLIAEVFYAVGNLTIEVSQKKRSKQCFAQSKRNWYLSVQRKDIVEYYRGEIIEDSKLKTFLSARSI